MGRACDASDSRDTAAMRVKLSMCPHRKWVAWRKRLAMLLRKGRVVTMAVTSSVGSASVAKRDI